MLADPLTKRSHKANLQCLLQVMKSGHYTLGSELGEDYHRQQEREAGRILQRSKGKPFPDEQMPVRNVCRRGALQATQF